MTLEVSEWRRAFESDRHPRLHFVPNWLDALDSVARTTLFGDDDMEVQARALIDVLGAVMFGLVPTTRADEPLTFAFRTEYSLIAVTVTHTAARTAIFQLLTPVAGDARMAHSLRCLHLGVYHSERAPMHRDEMTVPSKPDEQAASVHMTHDLGKALNVLVPTHQYEEDEIVDDLDVDVERALKATQARSYTFLRLMRNEAFGVLDLNASELRDRVRRVTRVVVVASNASSPSQPNAQAAAQLARTQIAAASGGDIPFDLVREVAATFYRRQLAHMRILSLERWSAATSSRVNVAHVEEYSIVLDGALRRLSIVDFLRRFRSALAFLGSQLQPNAFPFIIAVTEREAPDIGELDAETKHGLLVVDAELIKFVQLGVFDGQVAMRRVLFARSRFGSDRFSINTLPVNANFDALRGAEDAYRVRLELPADIARSALAEQIAHVALANVDAASARRGAALAPLFDAMLEAMSTNASATVTDMYGLLVFAHAYASAPADERAVMARIYRNYTPNLRNYVRELVGALYGNKELEQYTGSESSTESEEELSRSVARRRAPKNPQEKPIRLTHELAMSRGKRKGQVSNDDDDEDVDDKGEAVSAAKRPRINTDDDDGNELDDDEVENVVDAAAPAQPTVVTDTGVTEYVAHDLASRAIFDFVARNRPNDVAALQSVSRSFARVLQVVDPRLFEEMWHNKYPALAAEFGDQSVFNVFRMHGNYKDPSRLPALLTALYARLDELDAELEPLNSEVYDLTREIERARPAVLTQVADMDVWLEAPTIAPKLAQLAALRSIVATLDTQRGTARELIVRYEGRDLVSSAGHSTELQRRTTETNRAWTLLFSIVDNLAHHPRTRASLLAPGWQPENVEWLKTVDADRLIDIVPQFAYDRPLRAMGDDDPMMYRNVYTEENLGQPLRQQGRYYVARARLPPLGIATANITSEKLEAYKEFSPMTLLVIPTSKNAAAFDRETLQDLGEAAALGFDTSVERAAPFASVEDRTLLAASPDDVQALTYFGAQFLESVSVQQDFTNRFGQPGRMIVARYWRKKSLLYHTRVDPLRVYNDRIFVNFDNDAEYFLGARQPWAVRTRPSPPWLDAGFTPDILLLAVDRGILDGLYTLASRLSIFEHPRDVELVEKNYQNVLRERAMRTAHRLVAMNEANATEVEEVTERIFTEMLENAEDHDVFADRQWVDAFVRLLRRARSELPDLILRETKALFVQAFGEAVAYEATVVTAVVAPTEASTNSSPPAAPRSDTDASRPVRRFRSVEYQFAQFLFTAIVIKGVCFFQEVAHDETPVYGEGSLSTIPRLFTSQEVPGVFKRRLLLLGEVVDFRIRDQLEASFRADVHDPERRPQVEEKLRSIGVRFDLDRARSQ